MGAAATIQQASFDGARTGRRISVVVRKGGNDQLARERLVVSRASALLTMFNRSTGLLPAHKRLLLAPRLRVADRVVRRLHRRVAEMENGVQQSSPASASAFKLARIFRFWPIELIALAVSNKRPTECAELLERLFLGVNDDLTRLRPKSLAHLLPE